MQKWALIPLSPQAESSGNRVKAKMSRDVTSLLFLYIADRVEKLAFISELLCTKKRNFIGFFLLSLGWMSRTLAQDARGRD